VTAAIAANRLRGKASQRSEAPQRTDERSLLMKGRRKIETMTGHTHFDGTRSQHFYSDQYYRPT